MSATLNSEALSAYFDHCPLLHVPGFTHPEPYSLNDKKTGTRNIFLIALKGLLPPFPDLRVILLSATLKYARSIPPFGGLVFERDVGREGWMDTQHAISKHR